jgi:transcriptional regulator with XRE-family HTH domain
MTQQELADKIGSTRANINRLENTDQAPRISTVRKLAEALGVDVDELVIWGEGDQETGKAAA